MNEIVNFQCLVMLYRDYNPRSNAMKDNILFKHTLRDANPHYGQWPRSASTQLYTTTQRRHSQREFQHNKLSLMQENTIVISKITN